GIKGRAGGVIAGRRGIRGAHGSPPDENGTGTLSSRVTRVHARALCRQAGRRSSEVLPLDYQFDQRTSIRYIKILFFDHVGRSAALTVAAILSSRPAAAASRRWSAAGRLSMAALMAEIRRTAAARIRLSPAAVAAISTPRPSAGSGSRSASPDLASPS